MYTFPNLFSAPVFIIKNGFSTEYFRFRLSGEQDGGGEKPQIHADSKFAKSHFSGRPATASGVLLIARLRLAQLSKPSGLAAIAARFHEAASRRTGNMLANLLFFVMNQRSTFKEK